MLFTPGVMTSLDAIYRDVSPELHAATAGSRALPTGEAEEMAGASAWADMGFAALTDGALDRAAELFERGLTRPSMSWLIERPRLLVGSALLALTRGRPDEAERLMREAREFTEQREMRCMMPLLDLADGQVAAAHGNVDGSLALLARSEEAACRMEMRPLVLRAQMTTADLLAAVGRDEEAERKRSEAGRTIQDIAAQLQNEDIRAAFLAGTVGDERTVGEHGQTSNIHR